MSNRLEDGIDDLCRRHGLTELYVFGRRAEEIAARVRGDADGVAGTSDVDVGEDS